MKKYQAVLFGCILFTSIASVAQINFVYTRDQYFGNEYELGIALKNYTHGNALWDSLCAITYQSDMSIGPIFNLTVDVQGNLLDMNFEIPKTHDGKSRVKFLENFDADQFEEYVKTNQYVFNNVVYAEEGSSMGSRVEKFIFYSTFPGRRITVAFPQLHTFLCRIASKLPEGPIDLSLTNIFNSTPFGLYYNTIQTITCQNIPGLEYLDSTIGSDDFYNTMLIYCAINNIFGPYTVEKWLKDIKSPYSVSFPNIDIRVNKDGLPIEITHFDMQYLLEGYEGKYTSAFNENTIRNKILHYLLNHNVRFKLSENETSKRSILHLSFPGIVWDLWEKEYRKIRIADQHLSFYGFCNYLCRCLYHKYG